MRSHIQASIIPAAATAPCTAAIVGLRKSRALVPVHDLLVAQLALGRVAEAGPLVGAVEDLLEVMAGREVLARAGEHDDAYVVVGIGGIQRGVDLVEHL